MREPACQIVCLEICGSFAACALIEYEVYEAAANQAEDIAGLERFCACLEN